MEEVTIDTDWGARGKQLTGRQVQTFIKEQFKAVQADLQVLSGTAKTTGKRLTVIEETFKSCINQCLIAYHRKSDNSQAAAPCWEWPALENDGEVADGVLVFVDGHYPIIVSPKESQKYWALNDEKVGFEQVRDQAVACTDHNGQSRTAAIMSKAAGVFGETASPGEFAASWCYELDQTRDFYNEEKQETVRVGIKKNKWWLPSIGELVLIWKDRYSTIFSYLHSYAANHRHIKHF